MCSMEQSKKKKVSHKKIKTVNLLVVTKRRFAGKTNPEKTWTLKFRLLWSKIFGIH